MDIGEIKEKILEDKAKQTISYRRYPVRFLFMEMGFNTQNDIENLVKSTDGELLELSDYIMKKDDGWLTKSRFLQVIKQQSLSMSRKDIYVVGFSEMIRFYSKKEIESTILSLFDIENPDIMDKKCAQRRIYIICFSMMDDVHKVIKNSFHRFDLIDPFINDASEFGGKCREICFVSDSYESRINYNKIKTTVEWIGLWRHSKLIDFGLPIWCCSNSLYEWHNSAAPDNAFQLSIINNTKEYMIKAYNCAIDFPYDSNDEVYWENMCSDYEKIAIGKSFKDFIHIFLNSNDNSAIFATQFFMEDSVYKKWLIEQYVLAYLPNSFLAEVFSVLCSNSKKDFINTIWKHGYYIRNQSQLEERVQIIDELNKYSGVIIPEAVIQSEVFSGIMMALNIDTNSDINMTDFAILYNLIDVNNEKNIEKLSDYYYNHFKPANTGLSNTEKEGVIFLYSIGIIDFNEIKSVYYPLYTYLDNEVESNITEKDEYKQYLQAYRVSKIQGFDNPFLKNYYDMTYSSSEIIQKYYELSKQDEVIHPYIENADIYVIDGVGAEYLPLLIGYLKKYNYTPVFYDYASCHLPSITEVNKKYLSSVPIKEWKYDFDKKVIHDGYYRRFGNIRKSLNVLEEVIKEIVMDSNAKRIVITADHGATARPQWVNSNKKYDFSKADHEGRCCQILAKDGYSSTEDYMVFEDDNYSGNKYLISFNSQSLYKRPRYEGHGGATIEEMLVPVIVADPYDEKRSINYKIIPHNLFVSGLKRTISFTVAPNVNEKITVIEADGKEHIVEKENSIYSVKLNSGKEQKILIMVDGNEFSLKTKSKAAKNMEADDGFDDEFI